MKTASRRHELSLGDPPLYLLVDAPESYGPYARGGPSWIRLDETIQRVHVMSRAAGGEVRSYWIARGALYHADCHPMSWPEVDAEVAGALHLDVRGWQP